MQECLTTDIRNRVALKWVPEHIGIERNEKTDLQAKLGVEDAFICPEPYCAKKRTKGSSRVVFHSIHSFGSQNRLRQSKCIIEPYSRKPKTIIGLNKNDIKLLTGLLTSNCKLGMYGKMDYIIYNK